jgi:uncharacterized protein YjeT (DUF2065 family)
MELSRILCVVVALFVFLEGITVSLFSSQLKKTFEEVPAGFVRFFGFLEAIFGLAILFLLSRNL